MAENSSSLFAGDELRNKPVWLINSAPTPTSGPFHTFLPSLIYRLFPNNVCSLALDNWSHFNVDQLRTATQEPSPIREMHSEFGLSQNSVRSNMSTSFGLLNLAIFWARPNWGCASGIGVGPFVAVGVSNAHIDGRDLLPRCRSPLVGPRYESRCLNNGQWQRTISFVLRNEHLEMQLFRSKGWMAIQVLLLSCAAQNKIMVTT